MNKTLYVSEHIMKRLITIIIFLLLICKLYATGQIKDILLLNGDTCELYESPLEQVKNISEKIRKITGDDQRIHNTGCWRGFKAKWIVKDSVLYLLGVKQCNSGKVINNVIEQVLGKKFHKGLMKADWVNGYFWCGKDFAPYFVIGTTIYRHEYRLNITNGIISEIKESPYFPCEYSDHEKIRKFIFSKIDWSTFPDIKNKKIELSAYVNANKTGEITNVKIENKSGLDIDNEFINIIKQLPCFPVYYYQGEFWDWGETIFITINKQNKLKYAR